MTRPTKISHMTIRMRIKEYAKRKTKKGAFHTETEDMDPSSSTTSPNSDAMKKGRKGRKGKRGEKVNPNEDKEWNEDVNPRDDLESLILYYQFRMVRKGIFVHPSLRCDQSTTNKFGLCEFDHPRVKPDGGLEISPCNNCRTRSDKEECTRHDTPSKTFDRILPNLPGNYNLLHCNGYPPAFAPAGVRQRSRAVRWEKMGGIYDLEKIVPSSKQESLWLEAAEGTRMEGRSVVRSGHSFVPDILSTSDVDSSAIEAAAVKATGNDNDTSSKSMSDSQPTLADENPAPVSIPLTFLNPNAHFETFTELITAVRSAYNGLLPLGEQMGLGKDVDMTQEGICNMISGLGIRSWEYKALLDAILNRWEQDVQQERVVDLGSGGSMPQNGGDGSQGGEPEAKEPGARWEAVSASDLVTLREFLQRSVGTLAKLRAEFQEATETHGLDRKKYEALQEAAEDVERAMLRLLRRTRD
ncbi:hypothetical protein CI109_101714 [Kwoniella shandongensis]|uniref:Uncharacterized protein n=1 Tax=Kwoniella shandongensis TaxID=1734106 RepID=A0A5M6C993_9TREE|nr:uncharacterized protein CI109_001163 [Kwoniella shandongensis]KAA5530362.1 hypothetical protein CI109_001163 [Kwoniella shandongensis]